MAGCDTTIPALDSVLSFLAAPRLFVFLARGIRHPEETDYGGFDSEEEQTYKIHPACDSFVLAHPDTLEPMGSLAGPELRKLRFEAHRQFGQLHKAGIMTKRQSYQWLAQVVHAPMSHAHIGHLGEYYCKEVIRESKELLQKNQLPEKGTHKDKGGVQNVGAYTARAGAS